MKKIVLLILLIFSFQYLLCNKIIIDNQENKKIRLPKIPIYIDNQNISNELTFNQFQFESINNSFYRINISNPKIINKKSLSGEQKQVLFVSLLLGFSCGIGWDIGMWLGSDELDENDDFKKDQFKFSGTAVCTAIGAIIGLIYANSEEYHNTPVTRIYNIDCLKDNDVLNSEVLSIPFSDNIESNTISSFLLRSDKQFKKWDSLYDSYEKYNKDYNLRNINTNYEIQWEKKLSLKREFETTIQYDERIKKEQFRENELQAEIEQEISISKEKREIEKFALLQNMKEEINNIEFTKTYDFEISNYNADRQSFSFNIAGTEKRIVVPIQDAPAFKKDAGNYSVHKIFKPTLHGTWETVSDDYVLINTKTDEIIPWEGSIPTYAETSVENPPILSASLKLIEPSGEGYLDAEETSIIQVTLTNSGKGSAKMTRISLFQEDGPTLYYDVSNTIDEILPNQSITSEFKISVPGNIENGNVKFKVSFIEEQGFEPAPLTFSAETREMPKPELQFIDFGVDDASGDGIISKGETADITLRVQNIGHGKAKQVVLNILEDRLNNIFIISDKHFKLGELKSGESKDVIFTISTNNRVNNAVNINFNIQEKRPQFSIDDNITLEFEKNQKQLEPIIFVGKDFRKEIEYAKDFSIDIEEDIPASSKKNDNLLAIVFGIEDYKDISDVSFAHRDARFIKEYFGKTLGVKENNIYYKANEDVSKAEFDKVFSKGGWLDKRVKRGKTEIYFYYAGHGAPDITQNKAYLIPYDGDPNYASQTGYEMEDIYNKLADLKAKSVTVFLDACFTGANRESEMLLADARPLMIEVKSPIAHGITVFSATGQKEISSAWREKKHGLFSYFLMKGMQGEADVNNDNKLTIKELGNYIQEKVSEQAGYLDREQTPQMISDNENRILINY